MKETVNTLLKRYRKNKRIHDTDRILFEGVSEDVYNISSPFENKGKTYIAGRVEKRTSEISKVMFFKEENKRYVLDSGLPVFDHLQDPAVSRIGDELIMAGTRIHTDDLNRITGWHTAFYRGKTIDDLRFFARAPQGMKDVRLFPYQGQIGIFTRPQGGPAGLGKIGFTMVDTLEDVNEKRIAHATLLDHFIDSEWGGVNQVHILSNGKVGVLGHIACRDNRDMRHYYAMAFAFDPESLESTPIRIIAERSDFKEGPSKRPDLQDVLFTGGLVRLKGRALLYTGVSDCEAHVALIDDPFAAYETKELSDL